MKFIKRIDILATITIAAVILIFVLSTKRSIEFRNNGGIRGWVVDVAKEIIEVHH